MSAVKLFLALTIVSTWTLLIQCQNLGYRCNDTNRCYETHVGPKTQHIEGFFLYCKNNKLQCCYKSDKKSCTLAGGLNPNGLCTCVDKKSKLLPPQTKVIETTTKKTTPITAEIDYRCNETNMCHENHVGPPTKHKGTYFPSCLRDVILCCYKSDKKSCTLAGGLNPNGVCTCVNIRAELLQPEYTEAKPTKAPRVETTTEKVTGCLNNNDCRGQKVHGCTQALDCDCVVDFSRGYYGECKNGKRSKCVCSKTYWSNVNK